MSRIYLSPPHMTGEEQALVADAFSSNWIAPLGPHVDAFEQELAAVVGVDHGVALSSGTAALHLALQLSGVGPGDSVLTSTFTFVASVNPIRYLGATPYLIDSERVSWNLDPGLLAEALERCSRAGRPPKALVVVHLYGQCADLDPVLELCGRYGVTVIEDAAEALGATYGGRPAGSLGRFGVFSFNGNKIITTSGGGMLVSRDGAAIDAARHLATQAREPTPHYEHRQVGYNYRLSNLLAAVGRGQLLTLEARVAARRRVFAVYAEGLGELDGIEFMPEAPWGRHTRWLTCLTIDPARFGADRETVRVALEAANIEARPLWKPMHQQPLYAGIPYVGGGVSDVLFQNGLCLPSGSGLTDDQQDRVMDVVRGVHRSADRRRG
jgi:dTDP-4-amino-4,6-dideoxygalactose transaminase